VAPTPRRALASTRAFAVGHFIREVAHGADIDATLEAYAKLDADFIKALGGDRFAPALLGIDMGSP
jgi:hypothetical protein